jgi:hypothetical protein
VIPCSKTRPEAAAWQDANRTSSFVNQRCALTLDLESVVPAQAFKIVLQHDLPIAAIATPSRSLETGVILQTSGAGGICRSSTILAGALVPSLGTFRNQKTLIRPGAAKVVGMADR